MSGLVPKTLGFLLIASSHRGAIIVMPYIKVEMEKVVRVSSINISSVMISTEMHQVFDAENVRIISMTLVKSEKRRLIHYASKFGMEVRMLP